MPAPKNKKGKRSAKSKPGSSAPITASAPSTWCVISGEWSYRFNRRNLPDGLDGYLIRCAVECTTITEDQPKAGILPDEAKRIGGLAQLHTYSGEMG